MNRLYRIGLVLLLAGACLAIPLGVSATPILKATVNGTITDLPSELIATDFALSQAFTAEIYIDPTIPADPASNSTFANYSGATLSASLATGAFSNFSSSPSGIGGGVSVWDGATGSLGSVGVNGRGDHVSFGASIGNGVNPIITGDAGGNRVLSISAIGWDLDGVGDSTTGLGIVEGIGQFNNLPNSAFLITFDTGIDGVEDFRALWDINSVTSEVVPEPSGVAALGVLLLIAKRRLR